MLNKVKNRFLLMAVLLMALVIGGVSVARNAARYIVEVDGQPLGAVRSKAAAERAVEAVKGKISREMGEKIQLAGKVNVRQPAEGEKLPVLTEQDLQALIAESMPLVTPAYMIVVNATEVVALPDLDSAQVVVAEIQQEYEERIRETAEKRGQATIKDMKFAEEISYAEKLVEPDQIRNREDAKTILKRGTDKLVFHTVQRGESLWSIARSRRMTEEQIRKANPEINPKRLKVGQQINLVVAEPYVHLESEEQVTFDEAIPFPVEVEKDETLWPWQEVVKERGVAGKRQVTVTIKRNNGAVVDRQVIDAKILSEPQKQIVRRGTKVAPDRGTGSFRWPLVGTITSKYGYRWREFHDGVDIAAPTGTPIAVADSGTITFAGWKGKLGKAIVVDHGGGNLVTVYGHLSAFNVEVGDAVEKGDTIGYVGNTGRSTGSHLHFEIRKSGKSLNPFTFYAAQ